MKHARIDSTPIHCYIVSIVNANGTVKSVKRFPVRVKDFKITAAVDKAYAAAKLYCHMNGVN